MRSAQSVATQFQREHQSPAQTVLTQENRLVGAQPSASEQGGAPAQRATAQNVGL